MVSSYKKKKGINFFAIYILFLFLIYVLYSPILFLSYTRRQSVSLHRRGRIRMGMRRRSVAIHNLPRRILRVPPARNGLLLRTAFNAGIPQCRHGIIVAGVWVLRRRWHWNISVGFESGIWSCYRGVGSDAD